jgi:hypothetical protein
VELARLPKLRTACSGLRKGSESSLTPDSWLLAPFSVRHNVTRRIGGIVSMVLIASYCASVSTVATRFLAHLRDLIGGESIVV